jgi:hypothetical protein
MEYDNLFLSFPVYKHLVWNKYEILAYFAFLRTGFFVLQNALYNITQSSGSYFRTKGNF